DLYLDEAIEKYHFKHDFLLTIRSCQKYLTPYFNKILQQQEKLSKSYVGWVTQNPDIAACLHYYRAPLHRVFLNYSKATTNWNNTSTKNIKHSAAHMRMNTVSQDTFNQFLIDYELTPTFLSQESSDKLYRDLKTISGDVDFKNNLTIDEFIEALGRIAIHHTP
ncbi:uvrC, partial [Acrasis kona]